MAIELTLGKGVSLKEQEFSLVESPLFTVIFVQFRSFFGY